MELRCAIETVIIKNTSTKGDSSVDTSGKDLQDFILDNSFPDFARFNYRR